MYLFVEDTTMYTIRFIISDSKWSIYPLCSFKFVNTH